MSATARRNSEEISNSKKSDQIGKQDSNWSDLPRDIVECITGRMYWPDRIRIGAVCKAWSITNHHIPAIDTVPWALKKFTWRRSKDKRIYGDCRMLDPLSREYVMKEPVRGEEYLFLLGAVPYASLYGWILFGNLSKPSSFFLYSPFTTEVIKLPELRERFQVATFSLNSTSPKCIIFLIRWDRGKDKIFIKLCSPGDHSWKDFEFNNDPSLDTLVVGAVHVNGVFYCIFARCELGAFNVELKEWTVLTDQELWQGPRFKCPVLIPSDGDLLMLDTISPESWKLYKFDFSEMRWDYKISLNNHVLFIGRTAFSVPTVGETSQLTDTIFYCHYRGHPFGMCYGTTSPNHSESLLYRKCEEATEYGMDWIQLPSDGIWKANDLINGVIVE